MIQKKSVDGSKTKKDQSCTESSIKKRRKSSRRRTKRRRKSRRRVWRRRRGEKLFNCIALRQFE